MDAVFVSVWPRMRMPPVQCVDKDGEAGWEGRRLHDAKGGQWEDHVSSLGTWQGLWARLGWTEQDGTVGVWVLALAGGIVRLWDFPTVKTSKNREEELPRTLYYHYF